MDHLINYLKLLELKIVLIILKLLMLEPISLANSFKIKFEYFLWIVLARSANSLLGKSTERVQESVRILH